MCCGTRSRAWRETSAIRSLPSLRSSVTKDRLSPADTCTPPMRCCWPLPTRWRAKRQSSWARPSPRLKLQPASPPDFMPRVSSSAEQWATMLRKAREPEVWADPEAARKFAAAIAYRTPDIPPPSRTLRKKVQIALAVLKDEEAQFAMVRAYEQTLTPDNLAASRRIAVRDLTEARGRLQQAVPIELARDAKAWPTDAARLFALYRELVDPKGGISPGGPAVRFIDAALKAMGHRPQPIGAGAEALPPQRQ